MAPARDDVLPDTKDWTWVLDRPCPECGFASGGRSPAEVAAELDATTTVWEGVLVGPGVDRRPHPGVWSPLEYAAHVRDVHRVFLTRLTAMLDRDDPLFESWDQDAAAREGRYADLDPAEVAADLAQAADAVVARYAGVDAAQEDRPGRRSNGSTFTVTTLGRYHLHDVLHHLWDVRHHLTVAAYDAAAEAYRDASPDLADTERQAVADLASRLGAGARVLEIGSGGGRDALALEAAGLSVRRTDVAPAFVRMLQDAGHEAGVLDPRAGDLGDPSEPGRHWDGVWANASLLHLDRDELGPVLARLARATRPGGLLRLSVKEGDGEAWSGHGAIDLPRRFTYWREEPFVAALVAAGWTPERLERAESMRGERWLVTTATREDR